MESQPYLTIFGRNRLRRPQRVQGVFHGTAAGRHIGDHDLARVTQINRNQLKLIEISFTFFLFYLLLLKNKHACKKTKKSSNSSSNK